MRRLAYLACTRPAGIVCLILAYVVHPLIHGSFLDGGTLDAAFTTIQAYGLTTLHGGHE